jgi:hypothetical protein
MGGVISSFGPWAAVVYVTQHPTEMHVVDVTDTMGTSMTSLASEASSIAAGPGIGVCPARPLPRAFDSLLRSTHAHAPRAAGSASIAMSGASFSWQVPIRTATQGMGEV